VIIFLDNRKKQKEKESEQLSEFIKVTSLIPYESIIDLPQTEEPPDFEIIYNGMSYGIEVTELEVLTHLNRKYSYLHLEAHQNKILRKIKSELDKIVLPCSTVEVKVHFRETDTQGYNEKIITQPLIDLIVHNAQHLQECSSTIIHVSHIPGIISIMLMPGIIKNKKWLLENRIIRRSLHFVRVDPYEEITQTIRKKEDKIHNYKKQYLKRYLLLTANRYKGSQAFHLTDEFKDTVFQTHFDKVFYFESFNKLGLQLKTTVREI
jgi:hypothetical protein